jgi:hypothetical protein
MHTILKRRCPIAINEQTDPTAPLLFMFLGCRLSSYFVDSEAQRLGVTHRKESSKC